MQPKQTKRIKDLLARKNVQFKEEPLHLARREWDEVANWHKPVPQPPFHAIVGHLTNEKNLVMGGIYLTVTACGKTIEWDDKSVYSQHELDREEGRYCPECAKLISKEAIFIKHALLERKYNQERQLEEAEEKAERGWSELGYAIEKGILAEAHKAALSMEQVTVPVLDLVLLAESRR